MEDLNLCRQQVIKSHIPKLLKILLEISPPDEDFSEETSSLSSSTANYETCLAYAMDRLLKYGHVKCYPAAVSTYMKGFLERYQLEQLTEYGEAFEQLANVILNDPLCRHHVQENMQWRILEFMLCVNYKNFNWTRRNCTAMREKRKRILEAVPKVSLKEASPPAEEPVPSHRYGLFAKPTGAPSFSFDSSISTAGGGDSFIGDRSEDDSLIQIQLRNSSHSANYQSEVSRLYKSDFQKALFNLSLESPPLTAPSDGCNNVKVTENFNTPDARMSLTLNLMQSESALSKPTKVNYFRGSNDLLTRIQMPCWHVDVHVHNQPRMLASDFNGSYGKWLLYQLREGQYSVRRLSEEQQVVRELVILFFTSVDTDHFQWTDGGLELRKYKPKDCDRRLLTPLLDFLNMMRYLRQFIERHALRRISGDRLETFTSFSVALRRLLRPLVEFLVYFERGLVQGWETPTLLHLSTSLMKPLGRLEMLHKVCKTEKKDKASVRSLKLLESLFCDSSMGYLRPGSAALLLHSLQAYCQFLDNWWTTGDFSDWQDEFPYRRYTIEGRTEYGLREDWKTDAGLLNEPLFQVFRSHVLASQQAVAILYDSRRLGDFISVHGFQVLKISLHNSLMEAVLQELMPYQTEQPKDMFFAPDILQQLKDIDVEPVRQMFYAYHMETRPDPRQPAECSADELMRNFQSCVPFAPVTDIIRQELERLLRQRSLLANSYVSDLIRNHLGMHKVIVHLRSVFLLIEYKSLRDQFEEFFKFLRKNRLVEAACRLREIVVSQNQQLSYLFQVSVKGCHPDNVSLRIIIDSLLSRVISQAQVEQLNRCFRLILNFHFTRYELKRLPALKGEGKEVEALKSLRPVLYRDLQEQFSNINKMHLICYSDINAEYHSSLEELHQSYKRIVLQAEKQLVSEVRSLNLEQVLHLSKVLKFLWLTARPLIKEKAIQESKEFSEIKDKYLDSIPKHCRAIEFLLKGI